MNLSRSKKSLLLVNLKYGSAGGFLVIFLFIILFLLNQNPLVNGKKIDILLFFIFIFFSTKEFRDSYNNQKLTVWEGLVCGGLTFLIMAVLSASFIYIFLKYFHPDLLSDYIQNSIQYLSENKESFLEKKDPQTFDQLIKDLKSTSAYDLGVDDFLKKTRIGIFLTIIVSVILRKSPLKNSNHGTGKT